MTGLAGGSEELFIIGENRDESKPVIVDAFWPLPLPTNETDIPGMYYFEFDPPKFKTRDIAYEKTGSKQVVWAATGEESYPIKVYQIVMMSTQKLIDSLPAAIGIGSDVWGLSFEKSGSDRFLWTNNRKEGKIYKIDLDAPTEKKYSTAQNQCLNNVTICSTTDGIQIYAPFAGSKTVTITDLQGRTISSFSVPYINQWCRKRVSQASGILIVSITWGEGKSITRKVLVGR